MISFERPMGIGAILDRSFQIYRKHFTVTFLLMLLFFGPLYLLQNLVLFDVSSVSLLPESGETIADSLDRFAEAGGSGEELRIGLLLFSFLLMPLYMLAVFPAAVSSQLHLVRAVADGASVGFKELLRSSFSRYWPMVGNTLLFGLILVGVYTAISTAVVFGVIIVAAVSFGIGAGISELGSDPFGSSIVLVVLLVGMYLLVGLLVMAGIGFFAIRFGFYLPVVALEGARSSLSRSWKLTKGNFWRIFGIYFVLSIIYSVFMMGTYALLIAVFKLSLLGQLIYIVLTLLITPIYMIPYAVTYFDLRVRNEGADLEQMLAAGQSYGSYSGQPGEAGYAAGFAQAGGSAYAGAGDAVEPVQTDRFAQPVGAERPDEAAQEAVAGHTSGAAQDRAGSAGEAVRAPGTTTPAGQEDGSSVKPSPESESADANGSKEPEKKDE
ncbi:ABC transporter ATP-binding protein [Paenibacillus tyrfis]|uniref:ABC transporter ATP-binding protein n=1 Tax=Paenibacillus tyrfis TaxID=1501230 RepID=UPI00209D0DA7|nr:ABC transporter ATP-binding protein [Paenibacillus tyrfis]MCP1310669.1 ABC transporter ATP-binding protein [Paenibacillus tyrfis]